MKQLIVKNVINFRSTLRFKKKQRFPSSSKKATDNNFSQDSFENKKSNTLKNIFLGFSLAGLMTALTVILFLAQSKRSLRIKLAEKFSILDEPLNKQIENLKAQIPVEFLKDFNKKEIEEKISRFRNAQKIKVAEEIFTELVEKKHHLSYKALKETLEDLNRRSPEELKYILDSFVEKIRKNKFINREEFFNMFKTNNNESFDFSSFFFVSS